MKLLLNSSVRAPEDVGAGRIGALATLPVFYKLEGRKAVVAGDGEGARWKAELLAAAGAHVLALTPEGDGSWDAIVRSPTPGFVEVVKRGWVEADLKDAAIAIAECDNDDDAAGFADAARRNGAPVNIIDRPRFCDFQFGAIVNRSPLIVSISTDGAAPVFGQSVRAKIEALLPQGLQRWAAAAREWRTDVQSRERSFAQRRGFWERFTDLAWRALDRPPDETDRTALVRGLDQSRDTAGRVTLVGAGPGDPELLTLKAVRVLQSADVILYDDLAGRDVLEFARREARRMLVGKSGHGPSCKQDEINRLMVALARQGKHVVRLKGGDPGVFGRATEEIEACRAAGVPVAIVPGITAAQGAAATLGVSLTERGKARRLQFVTGHDSHGKLPVDLDWTSLADPGATSVVYMPRGTLAQLARIAIENGLDPSTPAVAVSAASRPEQQTISSSIEELAAKLGSLADDQPVLVMFGQVFAHLGAAEISGWTDSARAAGT